MGWWTSMAQEQKGMDQVVKAEVRNLSGDNHGTLSTEIEDWN